MPGVRGFGYFLRFWLPVYLYAGLIFVLSAQSTADFGPRILWGDKLIHLVEYAILGYLLTRAMANSHNLKLKTHFRLFAICIGVLYGLSDEFHQYFVPGREVEFFDFAANALGVILGQIFWKG